MRFSLILKCAFRKEVLLATLTGLVVLASANIATAQGNPYAGVAQGIIDGSNDDTGQLYGTTQNGGTYAKGTLYKLSTSGGAATVMHSFGSVNASYPVDGIYPMYSLNRGWGTGPDPVTGLTNGARWDCSNFGDTGTIPPVASYVWALSASTFSGSNSTYTAGSYAYHSETIEGNIIEVNDAAFNGTTGTYCYAAGYSVVDSTTILRWPAGSPGSAVIVYTPPNPSVSPHWGANYLVYYNEKLYVSTGNYGDGTSPGYQGFIYDLSGFSGTTFGTVLPIQKMANVVTTWTGKDPQQLMVASYCGTSGATNYYIFGAAKSGGSATGNWTDYGTIFYIDPSKTEGSAGSFNLAYTFRGWQAGHPWNEGTQPIGRMTETSDGQYLYGTTSTGGFYTNSGTGLTAHDKGTIYRINLTKALSTDKSTCLESTYVFDQADDGSLPCSELTQDSSDTITSPAIYDFYGTAYSGGNAGRGSVYKYTDNLAYGSIPYNYTTSTVSGSTSRNGNQWVHLF